MHPPYEMTNVWKLKKKNQGINSKIRAYNEFPIKMSSNENNSFSNVKKQDRQNERFNINRYL